MKIKKITQSLILVSVLASIFCVARGNILDRNGLWYLIWNLFLAWIPYIISLNFIKKDTPIKKIIPFFVIWILFFPNAPYLVTDILHMAGRFSSFLWYDSIMFFFFGWIGLMLGILSLSHVHQYLKVHFSYVVSEILVFVICFISSFGIYLGRFERWNSWDAFISPLQLMKNSLDISTNLPHSGTPLIFVVVFTVFLYSVYKTIDFLIFEAKDN